MAEPTSLGAPAEICARVHEFAWALPRHRFPFAPAAIPADGLYVLFEAGESGHGGDRIVRIGTHTGSGQLPSRLAQHFLNPNKDRSILRKNIGRALLAKEHDPFLGHWEIDRTTRQAKEAWRGKIDEEKQAATEARVSRYIQKRFSFVAFSVQEKAQRLSWESRLIGSVSRCPSCRPSPAWLGAHSPKRKIRESGLWLVQGLGAAPLTVAETAQLTGWVS